MPGLSGRIDPRYDLQYTSRIPIIDIIGDAVLIGAAFAAIKMFKETEQHPPAQQRALLRIRGPH